MARCPVCETRTIDHWIRGFVVGILLGCVIAFIGGQLFHKWQYGDIWKGKYEREVGVNDELKKGYVPPRVK